MISRKNVLIGLVLLLIISLVVLLVLRIKPVETLYVHNAGVTLSHGISASRHDSSLYISTNRNLVKYNPYTGKAQLLLNEATLPETANLTLSEKETSALFTSVNHTPEDTLGKMLAEKNIGIPSTVWWIADFASKKYTPISGDILKAGWSTNGGLYVIGKPAGKSESGLYLAAPGNLDFKLLLQQDNLIDGYATPNGYLVYFSDQGKGVLKKVATDGKASSTIASTLTRSPAVNGSGTMAVIHSNKGAIEGVEFTEDDLLLIDTSGGQIIKRLASKQMDEGYWSADGSAFYFRETTSGDLIKTSLEEEEVKLLKIDLRGEKINATKVLANGGEDVYLLDSRNRLYALSVEKEAEVTKLNPSAVSEGGLAGEGYAIYYYQSTNLYAISVDGRPFEEYKNRALNALIKAGANPDLLDIVIDQLEPGQDDNPVLERLEEH